MADIDELQIKIKADSAKASASIEKLASSMENLGKSLSFDTGKLSSIASGIRGISDAATGFKGAKSKEITSLATALKKFSGVDTTSFYGVSSAMKNLAEGMRYVKTIDASGIMNTAAALSKMGGTLATVGTSNLVKIKDDLAYFVKGMNSVGSLNFDTTGLSNLIKSISKLGLANSTQATANLPQISAQLQNFVRQMNKIGELKFDMTNMSSLVTSISRLGSVASGRAVNNIPLLADNLKYLFETLSKAPNVSNSIIRMTEALANLARTGASSGRAASSLGKSLNFFSSSAKKASKSSFSLAAAFGKLYASYWLLFRAFSKIKDAIDISSSLTEVENVVRTTFGNYEKLIQDFSKTSIQDFGMSELTAKQVASRFQAMGTAMGFSQGKMAEMSLELTKLTADMASFYDMEQSDVARNLQAVFTGETEPLRKYGLDLTQATLKEWAMKQGLDADISSMTQAEKTMLRYQYVMANTAAAQGDFARTADTWANQVRILKQSFEQLASIIGGALINAFKPFVKTLNAVMQKVISFATTVTDALGAIFGWKYEVSDKGIADDWSDASESADDIADSTGDAAKNIDKMNKGIRQFDELKLITTKDDSSKSGSGTGTDGVNGGAASGGLVQVDTIFKDYESQIKNLKQLGKHISNALSDAMESIDWKKVYSKARNFGKGLADFLNGLINPRLFGNVGKTIAGALNTALEFLNSFGTRFNWKNFGNSIATGINKFFKTFKFSLLARTLNTWAKGLLDAMITAIDKVNWFRIGKKIGEFLSEIDWKEICGKVAKVIWKAINAGLSTWAGIFSAAPIEGTIIGVISAIKISTITFEALDKVKTKVLAIKDALVNFASTVVAHPYLAIAAGIAAIALAVYNFNKNFHKEIADQFVEFQEEIGSNNQDMEDAAENLRDLSDATKELTSKSEASAEQLQMLADSYFELADKTNLTAADQERLKTRAQQLIDICPELAKQIDMTTGKYTSQKDELLKIINAQKEYYRVVGYKDVVEQYSKALAEANVELEVSEQNYKNNAIELDKLNKILSNIGATEDLNDWWVRNSDALKSNGIEATNAGDAYDELVKKMVFLEDEQSQITETQGTLREEVDKATVSYNAANEMLEEHTQNYNKLSDAVNNINFGELATNAASAIDELGGVFVNGKQVVGEEAVELYQTIVDSYGTTDQDMYNLGEKGIVQFGLGGKDGIPEAIPTMTDALEDSIVSWYKDKGYDVAVEGGQVIVKGFSDGGVTQSQNSVDAITGSIAEKAENKNQEFSDMGGGWAKNIIDGFNSKLSALSGETGKAMKEFAENAVKKPFTDSTEIHSPSKVFGRYAGYTIEGYNEKIEDGSKSTFKTIKEWANGIKDSFGITGLQAAPEVAYSFNKNITKTVNSNLNSNSDSVESAVGKEVRVAMSGIIDYDRLSEAIVSRLEKADITAVLDSDTAYRGTVKKWREEARRSQKNPVPIF